MTELELLNHIRPQWIRRVLPKMAPAAHLREDAKNQLEIFFNMLCQSVETGTPTWLDELLLDWAAALTQSDLEIHYSSLTEFINEIYGLTFDIIQESLSPADGMRLVASLLPCFQHAYTLIAEFEIRARVDYVSRQLQQAQQTLERLDRSKSDFIAVAAHELKTPLTLVEGYAAMLREAVDVNARGGSASTLINGIENGANRLRAIVDDMIDVSLIDNNLLSLNYQPIWLNRIFSALHEEYSSVLQERRQIFELANFPGSNEMNFGDPGRLMQVFENILANAIKFTPDGGKISINGRKLPGFIEVDITDTGIGIDLEDQAVVFDKFSRIGNSALHSSGKTKFKGGGPGLGLHIAKGIIEAHGGAIWVESPGCDEKACPGSTFHVLFPVHKEPPDAKTAKLFASLTTHSV